MSQSFSPQKHERILYLDCLRILAAFAVIVIHVTAQNWGTEILSWDRRIITFYNQSVSWPVNVFVMISGALFLDLDRPLSIKRLYTKNIFRLFTAFLFWSFLYALGKLQSGLSIIDTIWVFLEGRFHLWYLITAITLYAAIPIFRKITETKQITEYYLGICFVWIFLLPSISNLLDNVFIPYNWEFVRVINYWIKNSNFPFPAALSFYFVLGSYLHRFPPKSVLQKSVAILGLICYLLQMVVSERYITQTASADIPYNFSILKMVITAGVFLLVQLLAASRQPSKYPFFFKWIHILSDNTFGIYLVHIAVLYRIMDWFQLEGRLALPAIFFAPVLSLAVMAGSFVISWLLHQVPVLRKYVV